MGAGTTTRKAEPVSFWQSVQWQTITFLGSTAAVKRIDPQWHAPSTCMYLLLSAAYSDIKNLTSGVLAQGSTWWNRRAYPSAASSCKNCSTATSSRLRAAV